MAFLSGHRASPSQAPGTFSFVVFLCSLPSPPLVPPLHLQTTPYPPGFRHPSPLTPVPSLPGPTSSERKATSFRFSPSHLSSFPHHGRQLRLDSPGPLLSLLNLGFLGNTPMRAQTSPSACIQGSSLSPLGHHLKMGTLMAAPCPTIGCHRAPGKRATSIRSPSQPTQPWVHSKSSQLTASPSPEHLSPPW